MSKQLKSVKSNQIIKNAHTFFKVESLWNTEIDGISFTEKD